MATGTVQDWITEFTDYGLGDDISPDGLMAVINSVIQDVNTRQMWTFLQATATVAISSGTALVPSPARFNKAQGLFIDSLGLTLVPERRETIVKRYAGSMTTPGTPTLYYFVGQGLYVYPLPDQAYSATLDYYQDEVVVTTATLLSSLLMPVKHQDVYVLGCLSRLFLVEDDTELYSLFGSRFEKKIADMMDDVEMHQVDLPDRMVDVYEDGGWE